MAPPGGAARSPAGWPAASSVVTSNFRPGVMERWGIAYDEIAAGQPVGDLPVDADAGRGRPAPRVRRLRLDDRGARPGSSGSSGRPDRTPVGTGTHYPDHVPEPRPRPRRAAGRDLPPRGHRARARPSSCPSSSRRSTWSGPAVIARSVDGLRPTRDGNRSPAACPTGVFPVAGDDRWCAIVDRDRRAVAGARRRAGPGRLGGRPAVRDARRPQGPRGRARGRASPPRRAAASRAVLVDALQARGVPSAAVETSARPDRRTRSSRRAATGSRLEHPVMGSIVVNRVPFRSTPDEGAPRDRRAAARPAHPRARRVRAGHRRGDAYEDLVAREVLRVDAPRRPAGRGARDGVAWLTLDRPGQAQRARPRAAGAP